MENNENEIALLIVDDDVTIRHLLALQADKLGYKADSAYSGIEALRRIKNYRYQLVTMDLYMPDMDGFEAAAAIRAYERAEAIEPIPILALSADPDKKKCFDTGMNECLQKPLLMKELKTVLERYLST